MGYLNEILQSKLILFLKITKFDQSIDKIVNEKEIIYQ